MDLGHRAWADGLADADMVIEKRGIATAHGWRAPLLVFVASATIFLASAWRLVPGPVYPGGDEPHYLVITQSLLTDHDLAIENNHARGDYRAYYASPLKPDYRVTGLDRTIYSIHPIGISVIIAPAFAVAGYRGALVLVALLTAIAMALQWRWLRDVTASSGAATVGWLAVASSAAIVLHSFSIYPECAAALAVMVAVGWGWSAKSPVSLAIQGAALGALPWLSTKYAPMSGVLLLLITARTWQTRKTQATDSGAEASPPQSTRATTDLLVLVAPYALSCVCWLAWFWWLWGTPSPTAPYGASHQMSLDSLKAGFPGLFADQEYGVFTTAPALALSAIGWWRLWRRDSEGRWLVAFTALPLLSLAAVTGAFALWWGGSAPPGRELVAALPLLGIPIAWLWKDTAARPAQRAVIETLILVGIVITATFVLARNGLLIANGRDGTAEPLEYLEPRRQLAAALPSFIAFRSQVAVPLAVCAIWIAIAAGAWALCRRMMPRTAGGARLLVSAIGGGACTVAALLVPAIVGGGFDAASPGRSAGRDAVAQRIRRHVAASGARIHAVADYDAGRRHPHRALRRDAWPAPLGAARPRAPQRAAGPAGRHLSDSASIPRETKHWPARSGCKLGGPDRRRGRGRSTPPPARCGPRRSSSTSTPASSASAPPKTSSAGSGGSRSRRSR